MGWKGFWVFRGPCVVVFFFLDSLFLFIFPSAPFPLPSLPFPSAALSPVSFPAAFPAHLILFHFWFFPPIPKPGESGPFFFSFFLKSYGGREIVGERGGKKREDEVEMNVTKKK